MVRIALLLIGLGALIPSSGLALETLVLGGSEEYRLGTRLEILEDPDSLVTLEDVTSGALDGRFYRGNSDAPNFGLTKSTYWVRFRLKNDDATARTWFLECAWSVMDLAEFYNPQPDGRFLVQRAGEAVPFVDWEIPYRNATFSISLRPHEAKTYYMRFAGEGTMVIPLTLFTPRGFERKQTLEAYGFGLFYGAIVSLILYNLFLFASLRDRSYIFYVLTLSFYAIYQLGRSGFLTQYAWPESPDLALRGLHGVGAATLAAALAFTRNVLMTRERVPLLDRALLVFGGAMVLSLLMVWPFNGDLVTFNRLAVGSGSIVGLGLLWASVVAARRGDRLAKYFVVGCAVWLLTAVVFALRGIGVVPSNIATDNGMQIGVLLSAGTLSFGLSDRIRALNKSLGQGVAEKEQLVSELQSLNVTLEDRIHTRTRQLEEQAIQLEATSRHKSEFLANMSHELRTPLNAIIGFTEVLLERMFGDLNKKQDEYLRDIFSSGHHLLSLINDVLDLAKVEAGRLTLSPATVQLEGVIDGALLLVTERASRRGIQLSKDIEPGLGEITADERKVKQILLNLLANAVKFTMEGGTVKLSARRQADGVCVSISDTGIGIAAENQELIFETFRQVGSDLAREAEGTGLGLALARRLAEAHGGRLWVESEVGCGSTFFFYLPQRLAVEGEAEMDSSC